MKNIILIGMPGAGKSTVGVLLAKTMLMNFVDTDLLIQQKFNTSLCNIISEKGTDEFLKIENDVICENSFENCVVATGGSAVFGEDAMKALKENGISIYLKLPVNEIEKRISDIKTRGVAIKSGSTISDIFSERSPLYEKYADKTVDCTSLSAEQCVELISRELK